MQTNNQLNAARTNATVKRRLQVKGVQFTEIKKDEPFVIQVEGGQGFVTFHNSAERAKDLISIASSYAKAHPNAKVRIIRKNGNRAVHRFISRDGKTLSSY